MIFWMSQAKRMHMDDPAIGLDEASILRDICVKVRITNPGDDNDLPTSYSLATGDSQIMLGTGFPALRIRYDAAEESGKRVRA